MLEGRLVSGREEFHRIFGGQLQTGIVMPKEFPYIYLIHTPQQYEKDNLNVDNSGGEIIHFACQGEKRSIEKKDTLENNTQGNRAVLTHASPENNRGTYRPLLLFETTDKGILCKGEYKLEKTRTVEETDSQSGNVYNVLDYFVLRKVQESTETAEVYYVQEMIEENLYLMVKLGGREELFLRIVEETMNYLKCN